ncbi:MAG: carbonic anhydrase [Clostridia bacterium]|nr:carbonic anhydrase [Clostridia bacterium]
MNAREKLIEGNRRYCAAGYDARREQTAKEGQHPYAIVICCSDSRVIPEKIFSADIGDLFVIRVAGNVLDRHALGSIEYAAEHLGCSLVLMLGHTGCGAVAAALSGHAAGFVSAITDDIRAAIGMETDPDAACRKNVLHGVNTIREAFASLPELEIAGAVYDIATGAVEWL